VPAGGIGCEGPTLTVRLFSQTPFEQITTLACDPDSHTSVALARLVLERAYRVRPELIDLYSATGASGEARLLIGDKVVCEEPAGFEHQLDLGAAWNAMTGLPFVFAVWCARQGVELGDLPQRLAEARERGMGQIDAIVKKYAIPRGWPAGLAIQYLTHYLKFDIGPRQLEAIRLFHQLAAEHGIIDPPIKPLHVAE
jgi:chorismate dehydratase